jgi:hypothetical protein
VAVSSANDLRPSSSQTAEAAALAHFAAIELELRDRITSLEDDIATYRAMASEALTSLHALTTDRQRSTERIRVLVDELRQARDEARQLAAELRARSESAA